VAEALDDEGNGGPGADQDAFLDSAQMADEGVHLQAVVLGRGQLRGEEGMPRRVLPVRAGGRLPRGTPRVHERNEPYALVQGEECGVPRAPQADDADGVAARRHGVGLVEIGRASCRERVVVAVDGWQLKNINRVR